MEKSKVSRAATRLEQRGGLITKQTNKTDRRLIHLALTDEGGHAMMIDLLPLAKDFQMQVERRLADTLGGLEAGGLDKILNEDAK